MSSWQRKYEYKGGHVAPRIFVGCVLGILGLVMSVILPPWGLLVLALAVGVPIAMAYFGTNITILAGPEGFSVTTESKRAGRQHGQYGWHEIVATRYEEFTHRDKDNRTKVTPYFTVESTRGQAFRVSDNISQFEDLIQVFNHMTTHLPYIWQPQAGMNVTLGPVNVGRSRYIQAPRQAAPPPPHG